MPTGVRYPHKYKRKTGWGRPYPHKYKRKTGWGRPIPVHHE